MGYKFGGNNEDPRERFYQLRPVPDPVLVDAAARRPHTNAATGRVLFRQSVMPIGKHAGKIMERVPLDYLRWIHTTQGWMKGHHLWGAVWDYCERELPPTTTPTP